jgi:hypothetical protein
MPGLTYHFAAQHFSALSLYRVRAERGGCVQTRRLDRFFALSVGRRACFLADIRAGTVAYQEQWIDHWSITADRVGAERIRDGAIVACLIRRCAWRRVGYLGKRARFASRNPEALQVCISPKSYGRQVADSCSFLHA